MTGWYLDQISIEGFRGINNEGAPLVLKFKPDSVNSLSAPNGIGKSSVFEAITYAITGRIPKLEELPAAERGPTYYLNRFHSGGVGTVALTLSPAAGGSVVTVTVTRDALGNRNVTASGSADGTAILAELDREFVLLDGKTFQYFIDLKPLERGRAFAGLLGLRRYSELRQALLGLSNTRAFNNHFGVAVRRAQILAAESSARRALNNIQQAYPALVGEDYDPAMTESNLLDRAHAALYGIELLKPLCEGKTFLEIDPGACVEAAKTAEGGEDREKLAQLLRQATAWQEALQPTPNDDSCKRLVDLADARDRALAETPGDLFRQLYGVSEQILAEEQWTDKNLCPTCERSGPDSVLDHVRKKIAVFDAVGQASSNVSAEWAGSGWGQLTTLERLALAEGESPAISAIAEAGTAGTITGEQARKIVERVRQLVQRAKEKIAAVTAEKEQLEKTLPPKLTAVVEKAEAARRLQTNLTDLKEARARVSKVQSELDRIQRVKDFVDRTCDIFSGAESRAATRRLEAIEPLAQSIFKSIMSDDVVPALKKRAGTEELSISLAEFWNLHDVSAQALLSESYRNAFAISVYLAAASLYGGPAKFMILDDVTSSFDSGHQLLLMKVIREKFARPADPSGPEVIILSHDTALEKFFNTSANEGGWWHQRIEGTARTAILPQSGAVNKVRDSTLALLDAGNVTDAGPRIRLYLEYKLTEVITRLGIPVPPTIAFHEDKHLASNLIGAIKEQVKLQAAAATIVLDQSQQQGLTTSIATIVGNYLSHWSTGQAQAFSAPMLKGVMSAIDDFAKCFQFEDPPGSGQFRYYRSLTCKT